MEIIALSGSFIIGVIAGVISSTFGIGGATIVVPLLRVFLGVSGHVAIATALPITTFAAISGSYEYYKRKLIRYRTAIGCGIVGAVFSLVGAEGTKFVDEKVLMVLLSLFLLIMAIFVFYIREKERKNPENPVFRILSIFVIGAIAGFSSGFFGIGGGILIVPLLLYLGGLTFKNAVGTSLAIMVFSTIPGAISHYSTGNMEIEYTALILCGVFLGSRIGPGIVLNVSDDNMRKAFALILILLSLMLIANEAITQI